MNIQNIHTLTSNDIMYIVLTIIIAVCTLYLIRLNNDKKNIINQTKF